MPVVTVGGYNGPELNGAYLATLVDVKGPKTIIPKSGPTAGQEIDIFDWIWQLEDGYEIQSMTTTASGPKSNLYAYLTALNNGKAPAIGADVDTDAYKGRRVTLTIQPSEGGWPRVTAVTAIPVSRQQREFAQVTGTPTQGTPPDRLNLQPARVAPAPDDNLPF